MTTHAAASFRLTDLLVFAPFALSALALFWSDSRSDDENTKGVRALKKENYEEARAAFSRAIDKATDKNYLNAEAYLNLGLTRDKAGAPLQALKAYFFISKNLDRGREKFESFFNQGELSGRLGAKEAALVKYQQALDFKTDEQKIKENIEALFLSEKEKRGGSGQNGAHDPTKKGGGGQGNGSEESRNAAGGDSSPQEKGNTEGRGAAGAEKPDSFDNAENFGGGGQEQNRPEEERQGRTEKNPAGPNENDESKPAPGEAPEETAQNKGGGGPEAETGRNGEAQAPKGAETNGAKASASGGGKRNGSSLEAEGGRKKRSGAFEGAAGKAILDSLEKQEIDVRRRLFRQKTLQKRRRPGGKDW